MPTSTCVSPLWLYITKSKQRPPPITKTTVAVPSTCEFWFSADNALVSSCHTCRWQSQQLRTAYRHIAIEHDGHSSCGLGEEEGEKEGEYIDKNDIS